MAGAASTLGRPETPVRDRLITTLFVAALLHALVILGVTFTSGDADGPGAPGLQVLLLPEDVTDEARSGPASYLAQASHEGAGTTRERVAARTPLGVPPRPAQEATPPGNTAANGREAGAAAEAAEPLLTTSSPRATVRYVAAGPGGAATEAERALLPATAEYGGEDPVEAAQLTGPQARQGGWISPDTRSSIVAPYLDAWRRRVERLGTLNYPTIARGHATARYPVVEVQLLASGRLGSVRLRRSSGVAELDEAALQILRLASPFDPFPAPLARAYPVLRFAYEWRFEAGSQVSLQGAP